MQSLFPLPKPLRHFALPLIALGLVLLSVVPAEAQDRAGRFEIGFDLGATRYDGPVDDDSDLALRFRGGYFFTERLELEGQVFSTANVFGGDLETQMINVVYGLNEGRRVQPYVLGGIGAASFEQDSGLFGPPVRVDEDGFAYQAGIGSRFAFTRSGRFGGRLEVTVLQEDTLGDATHVIGTVGLLWTIGR